LENIKSYAGGITSVLLSIIGLLVVSQVVFGDGAPLDVIGNLQGVVTGFVGQGASLAGIITLLLIVALFQNSCCNKK